MNSALSRDQLRRQKKLRADQKIERKKGWLADHPEVALSIQREKEAEAEKRHALWLENEEKRKQLSAQVKKKMPANAFSALIGDDSTDEEATTDNEAVTDEEVKTQEFAPVVVSDDEEVPEQKPKMSLEEAAVRAKYVPMNNTAKKSWSDLMDEEQ
jgi:disulfide oxidoreductase YuzD